MDVVERYIKIHSPITTVTDGRINIILAEENCGTTNADVTTSSPSPSGPPTGTTNLDVTTPGTILSDLSTEESVCRFSTDVLILFLLHNQITIRIFTSVVLYH